MRLKLDGLRQVTLDDTGNCHSYLCVTRPGWVTMCFDISVFKIHKIFPSNTWLPCASIIIQRVVVEPDRCSILRASICIICNVSYEQKKIGSLGLRYHWISCGICGEIWINACLESDKRECHLLLYWVISHLLYDMLCDFISTIFSFWNKKLRNKTTVSLSFCRLSFSLTLSLSVCLSVSRSVCLSVSVCLFLFLHILVIF